MKIILLSGTNRPDSNTRKVVSQIEKIYATETDAKIEILDLVDLPAAIFSPAAYAEKPPTFAKFLDAVSTANGLHIVTPEYNGGAPGALKFFIDTLPQPKSFSKKPIAFTGVAAGAWGALRPVEQLQALAIYLGAQVFPERVFLPNITALLSPTGEIIDLEITKRLRAQAAGFAKFVGKISGVAG